MYEGRSPCRSVVAELAGHLGPRCVEIAVISALQSSDALPTGALVLLGPLSFEHSFRAIVGAVRAGHATSVDLISQADQFPFGCFARELLDRRPTLQVLPRRSNRPIIRECGAGDRPIREIFVKHRIGGLFCRDGLPYGWYPDWRWRGRNSGLWSRDRRSSLWSSNRSSIRCSIRSSIRSSIRGRSWLLRFFSQRGLGQGREYTGKCPAVQASKRWWSCYSGTLTSIIVFVMSVLAALNGNCPPPSALYVPFARPARQSAYARFRRTVPPVPASLHACSTTFLYTTTLSRF